MTSEKILEAVARYRRRFAELDIPAARQDTAQPAESVTAILGHCHAMLDEMEVFVCEGRLEKAAVWLGFVQGCLWSCRVYTVDQLRDQNRPDAERLTE